jgi:hypothetical protein
VKRMYFSTSVAFSFSLITFRMALAVDPIAFIVSSGSVLEHPLPEESDSSDISDCLVDVSCWNGVGEGSVRVGARIC